MQNNIRHLFTFILIACFTIQFLLELIIKYTVCLLSQTVFDDDQVSKYKKALPLLKK